MERLSVFEIHISRTECGEWKGTVYFPDNGEERVFCSFLELLNVLEEKDDCFEEVRERWKSVKTSRKKETAGNEK